MRSSLILVIAGLLIAPGLTAQSANDQDAVRKLIAVYVEAREQRDAKRLASILTPDADQLVSSGEWRRGRDALVQGMLASSERNSGTRTIRVETVRLIGSGLAIADGRYEIAGAGAADQRRMWTTFIVSRDKGVWRIEGIRNMLPASGR